MHSLSLFSFVIFLSFRTRRRLHLDSPLQGAAWAPLGGGIVLLEWAFAPGTSCRVPLSLGADAQVGVPVFHCPALPSSFALFLFSCFLFSSSLEQVRARRAGWALGSWVRIMEKSFGAAGAQRAGPVVCLPRAICLFCLPLSLCALMILPSLFVAQCAPPSRQHPGVPFPRRALS